MSEDDSMNSTSETSKDRREFMAVVTAAVAAGTVGLATGAQAQGTFSAAPMASMHAAGATKLSEVGVSEMPVKGNMSMRVAPATAALLRNLSSSISSTIKNSPGASADYIQYGYGSSIAGASHEELVVR